METKDLKQQTAVEWLLEQIRNNKLTFYNEGDKTVPITLVGKDIVEQAKELEKQQIINAVSKGWDNYEDGKVRWIGEQYYNETFNK